MCRRAVPRDGKRKRRRHDRYGRGKLRPRVGSCLAGTGKERLARGTEMMLCRSFVILRAGTVHAAHRMRGCHSPGLRMAPCHAGAERCEQHRQRQDQQCDRIAAHDGRLGSNAGSCNGKDADLFPRCAGLSAIGAHFAAGSEILDDWAFRSIIAMTMVRQILQ